MLLFFDKKMMAITFSDTVHPLDIDEIDQETEIEIGQGHLDTKEKSERERQKRIQRKPMPLRMMNQMINL